MTAGEFAGYVASILVFMAFYMKTMVPLRIVGIFSNLAFITYAILEGLVPVFLLHTALLPLNILRLREILLLVRQIEQTAHAEISLDSLLPLMGRRRAKARTTLFRMGDRSADMYYINHGVVLLPEINKRLEAGDLFGEISMFSPSRKRMSSAICESDVDLLVLSDSDMLRLYYQNPQFGFAMVRLITSRLIEDYTAAAAGPASSEEARTVVDQPRAVVPSATPASSAHAKPSRLAVGRLSVIGWASAAIALIVYATWTLAPYVRSVLFRDAAVTTWVNVATSPIRGNLEGSLPAPGQRVGDDGRLALVRNLQADPSEAAQATAEVDRAEARVTELQHYLSSLRQLDAEWRDRTSRYAETFKRNLATEVDGTRRELDYISRRLELERAVADRKQTLAKRGDAAQSDVDQSMADVMELERQRAERERLIAHGEERRQAAEQGVYLAADGRNPDWAHHRYDQLRLEIAQTRRALADAEAALAKARAAAAAERDALERSSAGVVEVPEGSLIWSSIAGSGAALAPGMPLAEWIDCSAMLVDVPAYDAEIALLRPGMPADVLIEGEGETRTGTVLLTRGSASPLGDADLAATASGRDEAHGSVIVSLVPTAQDVEDCAIGAAAWVEFPDVSLLDVLRARLRI